MLSACGFVRYESPEDSNSSTTLSGDSPAEIASSAIESNVFDAGEALFGACEVTGTKIADVEVRGFEHCGNNGGDMSIEESALRMNLDAGNYRMMSRGGAIRVGEQELCFWLWSMSFARFVDGSPEIFGGLGIDANDFGTPCEEEGQPWALESEAAVVAAATGIFTDFTLEEDSDVGFLLQDDFCSDNSGALQAELFLCN